MKKLTFMLGLIVCLASCRKYEDGPALSLRSPENRIVNTWRIAQDSWDEWQLSFKKNGSFSKTVNGNTSYGNWEFSKDKGSVLITYATAHVESFQIVELTDETFHFFTISSKNDDQGRHDHYGLAVQ